ncbi:MAG: hypothetical protein Q9171_000363 [Xanthocarpia ochracea]
MERSSSDHATPKAQTIILNVLSPSTEEVPKKLTFSDIPISTTVRALKERIQNTVPARPPLLRQRLIYQGKVLASDEISLKDVFGQEAISRSEALTLHLVLSPAPAPHTPTSSLSSTPNHAPQSTNRRHFTPSPVPQPNTLSSSGHSTQPIQQGAPAAASTVRQGPAQTPPGPNMQPLLFPPPQMPGQQGQAPMPPHLQNALNSHLAAMNQQFAAHFAAQGQQHHLHQGPPHTHFQTHQWQQPMLPQASFQQIIAQQQQNRAAAGQYGISQNPPGNQTAAAQDGQGSDNVQPSNHNPNPDTVVRENQGPNGESFRMVIQSTSISRPSSGMSQRPHSRASSHTPLRSSTPTNHGFHAPPDTAVSGTLATGNLSHNPRVNFQTPDPLAHFQQGLSAIETSLAGGTAPPQSVLDRARNYLDLMASQPNILPQGLEAPLRTRLNNLSTQADHLRASLNSVLSQVLANQPSGSGMAQASGPQGLSSSVTGNTQTGQPLAQDGLSSNRGSQATPSGVASTLIERSDLQTTNQTSPAPEVYLLSSPLGPHSLLVHHSGLYTTGLTLPLTPSIPYFQPPNFNPFPLPQVNPSYQAPHTPLNPQAPQNPPNQPAGVPAPMYLAQAQQQQAQAQAQNQPRDLARILLPLGGHLWLLIRLFGFVYFFTAGGGNRRAFLLGICAFIVFIANTGALRPLFRALWEPIRRHIEGLVPLAAAGGGGGAADVDQQRQRRQQPQQQQQQQQQQGRIEDGTDHHRNGALAGAETGTNDTANSRPDPQVLADRLLRDQANASLFRRAERAVALFVVSLVPGVGERHIAARDAAEARRMEEERQREAREAEEQVADEESDVAENDMERSEGERVRSESLEGSSSSGCERALHSSGEESGGDREGMRQRDPQEGPPLVEI